MKNVVTWFHSAWWNLHNTKVHENIVCFPISENIIFQKKCAGKCAGNLEMYFIGSIVVLCKYECLHYAVKSLTEFHSDNSDNNDVIFQVLGLLSCIVVKISVG